MAEKDFVVKNGLVVNSAITINSTAIYYNGSQFINSTSFEGTANNTDFVGTVEAANVVSNAQLAANLANYQTSAGMAANVAVLTANNSTRLNGQLASFYINAENISTGTLPSARISGAYTGITQVGTLTTLALTGNANFDSGVLFVDGTNNRVGISNTAPDTDLTVTGSANVSQDVRIGRDLYVGRDFIVAGNLTTTGTSVSDGDFNPASNGYSLGNTISLWNLLGIDATLTKNLSSNAVLVGTINSTSNGAVLTRTTFTLGNSSVNSTINSTSFTGSANNTSFVGTVSAANVVSNAQLSANLANYQTSAGLSANVATLTANNTSFVGTVSAANVVSNAQLSGNLANYVTSTNLTNNLANYVTATNLTNNLAALNATNLTTGTVPNARLSSVVVNTSANFTLAGNITFSGNTTLAGTNTAISSNVNITGSFLNVASSFLVNSTGAYHTGTVNAASHTVGTNFIANTLGVYHTGTVNAASHTVGTVVVANATTLNVNGAVVNSTGGFFSGLVNATGFTAANLTVNSNAIIWTGNTTTSPTITLANSGSFTIGNNTTTQTLSIVSIANSSGSANVTPAGFFGNGINITSLNATSITNGTLPSARISGAYTGITQVGTLAGATVTGNSNFDSGVLFVDGANNRVGVNTTTPSVSLQISSNDAIFIPIGTTLQRPTGANGMFRFNSDTSTFEGYSNGAWGTIAGSGAGGYYKGNLGATGNTNNKANLYRINSNTQSNNVTISTGENALTVGPMVIDSGFNLTIEEGGRAVII
jgi:hypothetical protein